MSDEQSPEGSNLGKQSLPEFIALIAILISLVALSIDAMLPALPAIGADLGVAEANDTQLVVSLFFLGFGVGQLIYGPISDSLGRKRTILAGIGVFVLGSILSLSATSYETMLLGRVLQGLGTAAPRTVTIAVVRDRFAGREMARIMSFIMAVFILVPAIAPALGQAVLAVANWQAIFFCLLALAALSTVWMVIRLPETLARDQRVPLSLRRTGHALLETMRNRCTFGYTIASGFIFGAFVVYLSTAQQVFQEVFGVGDQFPMYFAILALAIGAASITNAKLVIRFGMRLLSFIAIFVLTGLSAVFVSIALAQGGDLPLWAFMAWGMIGFFFIGLLFGNLNALAMEPLGHIAGTAAAFVGCVSSLLSIVFGVIVGQMFDGTVVPLIGGFAVLGAVAAAIMLITNKGWHGAGIVEEG